MFKTQQNIQAHIPELETLFQKYDLSVEPLIQLKSNVENFKGKHPANTALPSDPISLNLVPT